MRHHRIVTAGLTASAGLLAVAVAVPAQADPVSDLGQSVCPMITDSGSGLMSSASELANGASAITGKTAPAPEMSGFFSQMALAGLCPATMTSLGNGRLPGIPGVIDDAPGSTGLFDGGIPGLGGR